MPELRAGSDIDSDSGHSAQAQRGLDSSHAYPSTCIPAETATNTPESQHEGHGLRARINCMYAFLKDLFCIDVAVFERVSMFFLS